MKSINHKYVVACAIAVGVISTVSNCYSQTFAVQYDKMNVAYIGLPNPMHIVSSNGKCKNLIVKVSEGKIEGSGCDYIYYPEKVGKVTITTFTKKLFRLKATGGIEVRTKRLPEPISNLAGRTNGYISRFALIAAGGPRIEMPNFDYDLTVLVTKCTLVIKCGVDGETLFERTFENSKGVLFDEETIGLFKNIEPGDIVQIKDIASTHPLTSVCRDMQFVVTH